MMDLRANTAVDVLIGPFVDKTDGNTTEDSLTLTQAEIKLSKNGQALAQKNDDTSAAFDDDGYYNCELDATDTNTEGNLVLIVHQSANALSVRHEFNVLSEAAWVSLYAPKDTGFMDVNVKEISDDSTAADNLELQYNTTGLLGDTFPLRQDQGASISGGLAVRTAAASVSVIQGSEQDLANAATSDGSYWTGDDDGAGAEFIFRYTPADTSATPGDLHFKGFYNEPTGATNSATFEVYNFSDSSWNVLETLTNSSSDELHDHQLLINHSAPGSGTVETVAHTIGDVLIKFQQTVQETGNAVLNVDAMHVGFISSPVTASEIVDEWETQSQADPTGFHINVQEWIGTAVTLSGNNRPDVNVDEWGDVLLETTNPLPNAVADGAGGLPISDAGGLDLDTKLANTNEITVARMGALTDWINGGRLDLLLDAIKVITDAITTTGTGLSGIPWNAAWDGEVESEVNDALDTAISELSQAQPATTPTLRTALMLLYMALRNRLDVQTAGDPDTLEVYNDAGTKIAQKTITDDGSDYSEAKMVSGA